jgi:hypothetical protein
VIILRRPIGLTIVAFLTLLSSVALAFLLLTVWAVSAVGMGGGIPLTVQNLPYYLSWLLPIFAFLFSVGILGGITSRYLWYSLVVFWIVLVLFFVEWYTSTGIWHYMSYSEFGVLFLPFPFIYAVGCLVYFLTSTPKEYFHVMQ